MIRSAVLPAVIVCGFVVKSPRKVPGINMQSRVPVSMIPAERYNGIGIQFVYALLFARHRNCIQSADAFLDNPFARKIQEGLELVIDTRIITYICP